MARWRTPTCVSFAVTAAMFAFGASAEDQAVPQAEPQAQTQHGSTEPGQDQGSADAAESAADQLEGDADHPAVAGQAPGPAAQDLASDFAMAGEMDGLEPYKLLRSLQFVQDAVVRGDHSAMEMQRFLLGVIDSRLRKADQRVFDDPRNVDAALIYAMSGGNPETLEILAIKDKFGNFDNEITTVLRGYLNGHGAHTNIGDVVELYRDTEIGPYLTLVAANVTAAMNDTSALEMFDWARLTAPGTLVEEAALRRSLFISARNNLVDEALKYAQLYARRFINSPYAGQYADLLVDLVVLNYGKVGDDGLGEILSFMDRPRKREVYLRIARKAVISGLRDLAVFASAKAEALLDPSDKAPQALADLYSGMAKISTDGVGAALAGLDALPEQQLSQRDRVLREAARMIASEVVRKPDPNSLTQAFSPMVNSPNAVENDDNRQRATDTEATAGASVELQAADEATIAADKIFDGYVSDHQNTLERIDQLLEGVEKEAGS
ncbi:chemotaxis protein [Hoeflea sp.]|uniref:chemotaxis protein n=1 Tax=Hoeflea sp. TaxID=1940281 RepID=UPI002AFDE975|nr:chemotaxis protein [Hoeflea sp.]